MEKISIVIPYYNGGAYLRETLASVDAQTHPDIEVLVVDDGSTERASIQLLEELEQEGLKVLRQENGGPSRARNTGIAAAMGAYILPLDADDLLEPRALERLLEALLKSGAAVAYSRARYFGDRHGEVFLGEWSRKDVVIRNPSTCTALFRRSDWSALGGYNENMRDGYEDWDFWMSFIEKNMTAIKVEEVLFNYRIRKRSRNNKCKGENSKLWRMHAQMLKNHPGLLEDIDDLILQYYRQRDVDWYVLLLRRVEHFFCGISSRCSIPKVWA